MLLLNQVNVEKDGRLVAVDEIRTFRYGAAEGEHKVRISGITARDFFYRTKYNRTKAIYQASEAMKDIGRRARLQSMDDAACCIVKSPIFYPVVLVLYENENGRIQLTAFTARAFLAIFAINSALKKFDKKLPEAMVRRVSIHSVHDVNRAILHNLKSLVGKDDGADEGEYVNLKKLFSGGKNGRGNSGRRRRVESGAGESGTGAAISSSGRKRVSQNADQSYLQGNMIPNDADYSEGQEGSWQNGYDYDGEHEVYGEFADYEDEKPEIRESREERKARRKEERLHKKQEAARRKYEKLMGIDSDSSLSGGNAGYGEITDGYTDGYSNESDDDIMRELTGMSSDELDAGGYGDGAYGNYDSDDGEGGDDGVYDDYESDEATMRELTGMSSDDFTD